MKFLKLLLIIAVLFLSAFSVVAQTTEITEQQFWAKVYSGREKGEKFNRRETWTREVSSNKKLHKEFQSVSEYILPNKKHWIKTEESEGTNSTTEQIEIGQDKYCRKNKGAWARKDCTDMRLSSGPSPITKKFTSQMMTFEGKQVTVYTQSYIFEKTFEDFSFFVDDEGRVLREVIEHRTLDTKEMNQKTVAVYEYDPKNLKIEAPIKMSGLGNKKPGTR